MKDLRVPTGFFFALLGLVLLVYTAIAPAAHAPLSQVNVNLWGGLLLLAFGGVLLWLSHRAK